MARRPREPDWKGLLRGWDRQQESFNPDRERRFDAMFDILEASLPRRFTALDLGCGPGSLTARLLRRFPRARSVAVDFDPVVLAIGRGALRSLRSRITWVDAPLGRPGWADVLPARRYDAALSTTALHWLDGKALRRLYGDLGRLLRRGGLFLDGDLLPWDADRRWLRRLSEDVRKVRFGGVPLQSEWAEWTRWWERTERDSRLRALFEERKRRASVHPHGESPSLGVHERALRRAGFREVAVVWQDLENRILVGIR